MTPSEIDTALAALALREARARHALAGALDDIHRSLDERARWVTRSRKEWPTTDVAALDAARAKVAAPGYEEVPWGTSPAKALESHAKATAQLAEIAAEVAPLHAEWVARRWSRFFTVQQRNGHIHSGTNCPTCNRNGSLTAFGWNPELSGLTEADAVAKLGPDLCTVCFPSAPLEWTAGKPAPARCGGSGKTPVKDTDHRVGMRVYAECCGCGERHLMTQSGEIRVHKGGAPGKS